jgi:hypothetical protein
MNHKELPPSKDFMIYVAYDEEVRKFYVAESEFVGLILEDADAGRLISRLCDAAVNLLEVTTEKGWNQFGLVSGQTARLVPVFQASIPIAWIPSLTERAE